jgi:4-hydroxy-2-oxoheptanedioate aldolase
MVKSRVLRKLRAGDFVKTVAISRVPDPWLVETAGRIGFDLVWYDLEHRAFGYDTIDPMSLACRAAGMDLMVRIRKHGYDNVMRALEFGANGIMVPHCRTPEEAEQWVEYVRFPPLGRRGFDGAGADADFGLADPVEHLRHANDEVFLVLQIEDREAVEAIDDIAAVPGYDLLFIGPGDLTISYGVPMQFNHPLIECAYDRVAEAAARHGKWWGSTSGTPEAGQKILDRGGRLIIAGSDHAALVGGLKASFDAFSTVSIRG